MLCNGYRTSPSSITESETVNNVLKRGATPTRQRNSQCVFFKSMTLMYVECLLYPDMLVKITSLEHVVLMTAEVRFDIVERVFQ